MGHAQEWFMSPTQRRWSAEATINEHTYTVPNTWSVKQALKEIELMVQDGVGDKTRRLQAIRARAGK